MPNESFPFSVAVLIFKLIKIPVAVSSCRIQLFLFSIYEKKETICFPFQVVLFLYGSKAGSMFVSVFICTYKTHFNSGVLSSFSEMDKNNLCHILWRFYVFK